MRAWIFCKALFSRVRSTFHLKLWGFPSDTHKKSVQRGDDRIDVHVQVIRPNLIGQSVLRDPVLLLSYSGSPYNRCKRLRLANSRGSVGR